MGCARSILLVKLFKVYETVTEKAKMLSLVIKDLVMSPRASVLVNGAKYHSSWIIPTLEVFYLV